MKIQILQPVIDWESPRENLARFENLLAGASEADLIVLPEMFATGFSMSPSASEGWEAAVEWMRRMAREHDAAVVGSLAVRDDVIARSTKCDVAISKRTRPREIATSLPSVAPRNDNENGHHGMIHRLFNRMFFVRPDSTCDTYDKRHLFTYSGEDKAYTPGNERVVVEWRGMRLLLQVCYDLRFPVFSRARRVSDREPWDGDYDLIIYVASWPQTRINVWDTLLRARAIENLCFVVGCNRTGRDAHYIYNGHSAVIDPRGELSGTAVPLDSAPASLDGSPYPAAPAEGETLLTADLNPDDLHRFRRRFPTLADADDFELGTRIEK